MEATAEPAAPAATEPIAAPPAPVAPADPFALDEASVASLSPEQRASIDPILDNWRQKAKAEIERTSKSVEEKYTPLKEKAEALEKLTNWQPFQRFWHQTQQQMMQGQPQQTQNAVAQTRPQDFATPEEWSQAVLDASNGDPAKLQRIQQRMFATMATPVVQQLQTRQRELSTQMEMRDLMESHPDYKDLDRIGLDQKGEGTSLLEHCLDWAEKNQRSLEEGYQMARRWADSLRSSAKSEAMGLVQSKKDSVTAGPGTNGSGVTVVYVDSQDDLIKRSMEATLEGKKDIRFEVRPKK